MKITKKQLVKLISEQKKKVKIDEYTSLKSNGIRLFKNLKVAFKNKEAVRDYFEFELDDDFNEFYSDILKSSNLNQMIESAKLVGISKDELKNYIVYGGYNN